MILKYINKFLVTSLMILGISFENNSYKEISTPIITEINTDLEDNSISEEITPTIDNDIAYEESLLDKLSNKEVNMINTTDYILDNIDNLNVTDSITEEALYISAYAYQKILNSNINHDKALDELNTLLIEQSNPRCMDIEEYNMLYSNLNSTLDEHESLGDTFGVLAYLIHSETCNHDHYINDYYTIECEDIKNAYKKKRQ